VTAICIIYITALIPNLQFFGWGFWSLPSAVGALIKLDAVAFELGGNPFQASCPSGEWFGLSIQCTFVPWTPLTSKYWLPYQFPIHSLLKEVDRFRVKDSNRYRKSCVIENPGFLTNHLQITKCHSIPQHKMWFMLQKLMMHSSLSCWSGKITMKVFVWRLRCFVGIANNRTDCNPKELPKVQISCAFILHTPWVTKLHWKTWPNQTAIFLQEKQNTLKDDDII
jgi:hypothetical protein